MYRNEWERIEKDNLTNDINRKLDNMEAEKLYKETNEALDIAEAEKVTDRFVSRMVRLTYLSPDVLERLVILRDPPSVSVIGLIEAVNLPWAEQMEAVFQR